MSTQVPNQGSVTVNLRFWYRFVASLLLIPFSGLRIIVHLVFPLFGVFLLMTPFLGHRLGTDEILLALLIALTIWAMDRQNKLARGPITYVFDSEGMHASGPAFKQTIQWSGILRVRRLKRFLVVFIAPARAHFLPVRDFNHPDASDYFLGIAEQYTKVVE